MWYRVLRLIGTGAVLLTVTVCVLPLPVSADTVETVPPGTDVLPSFGEPSPRDAGAVPVTMVSGAASRLAAPEEDSADRAMCWPAVGGLVTGSLIIIIVLVAGRHRKHDYP